MILLLGSNSAFAISPNNGSDALCPTNSTKVTLADNSYQKLIDSYTTNTYQTVVSEPDNYIPIKIKMSIADVGVNTGNNGNFINISGTTADPSINIGRNFINQNSSTDLSLDFQNTQNSSALYLNSLALSTFDVDKSINTSTGGNWDDNVVITGITRNNGIITGKFQNNINNSLVINSQGLRLPSSSGLNCTDALDSRCQGSVVFTEPVNSVKFRYTNNSGITAPTSQRFEFRLDSYCYVPQYTFSGTVFNDNGGIAAIPANKQNISSTFTSNQNYFNGVFDSNETGISTTGLQVRLTDCSGTNIINTTPQTVSTNPIGRYTFNVPASALAGKTRGCLVEVEPNPWVYSVDTTTNSREVTLINNNYNYSDIDFGEVESDNAALVLIKSQYLYDCRIVNFNDINTKATPNNNPREGFTTSPATNAVPGECIAYRIEAFNRGHVDLKEVQISDTLQTTSVRSTFYTPQANYGIPNEVYTEGSSNPNDVKIDSNKFNLNKVPASSTTATKAALFFSTKYGTTSGTP